MLATAKMMGSAVGEPRCVPPGATWSPAGKLNVQKSTLSVMLDDAPKSSQPLLQLPNVYSSKKMGELVGL